MSAATECDFYAVASPTSDLRRHASVLGEPVGDANAVGAMVRSVVLHAAGASPYEFPPERWDDVSTRSAAHIIDRVLAIEPGPLSTPRRPEDRMIGNCYHQALLTCALLRYAGVAARARAGFADYLEQGKWTDHWICEVGGDGPWQRFDADLGRYLADGAFLTGGEAWAKCRGGDADPDIFGFEDARGWWFVRNNVVRDFAALCKVELLPWDFWGLMVGQDADRPDELIDELVAQCAEDSAWRARIERFEQDDRINPRSKVIVFRGGMSETSLPSNW
jgi:transglutaminase superfamily protein